jgi:hypothetical protein
MWETTNFSRMTVVHGVRWQIYVSSFAVINRSSYSTKRCVTSRFLELMPIDRSITYLTLPTLHSIGSAWLSVVTFNPSPKGSGWVTDLLCQTQCQVVYDYCLSDEKRKYRMIQEYIIILCNMFEIHSVVRLSVFGSGLEACKYLSSFIYYLMKTISYSQIILWNQVY